MNDPLKDDTSELLWQYIERLKQEGAGTTCHVRTPADLEQMAVLVPMANAVNKVMESDASDARLTARSRLQQAIIADRAGPRGPGRHRPVWFGWNRQLVFVALLLLIALVVLAYRRSPLVRSRPAQNHLLNVKIRRDPDRCDEKPAPRIPAEQVRASRAKS